MQNRDSLKEQYKLLLNKYKGRYESYRKKVLWLSFLRLIVFVGGVVFSVFMFRINNYAGFASLLAAIVVFAFLLKLFSSNSRHRDYNVNLLQINEDELKSLSENYRDFDPGDRYIDPSHSFSHDLDLFGKGSLFQAINRTNTQRGADKLAAWFCNPFDISSMFVKRRESIQELSRNIAWRQRFSALAMMNSTSDSETSDFFEWMKEDAYFVNNRTMLAFLYILPSISLILLILTIAGALSFWFLVLSVLFNLGFVGAKLRILNRIHSRVSKKSNYLSVVSSLIQHIEEADFNTSFLTEMQLGLGEESVTAVSKVKKLAALLQSFDSRLNMIMGIVLNGLLLWDFQCVVRIEKWKKNVSHLVPHWFATIESMDALSSLADYACNNPDYCYPISSDPAIFMEAEALGHHLIVSKKRVCNNYKLMSSGEINILTGANMAGKSTFLRTVGVNLILAMCGAPVCAKRFMFTSVDLFTSMRTSDSLSEEESYFFAELKRLRMLIGRLKEETPLFFILDEILKGTNSKDKSEGSWAFIEKVIGLGGTGIVATHDISLGALIDSYPDNIINTCFEIEILKGEVKFDYTLRTGVTTKMNAALLMKQQGII